MTMLGCYPCDLRDILGMRQPQYVQTALSPYHGRVFESLTLALKYVQCVEGTAFVAFHGRCTTVAHVRVAYTDGRSQVWIKLQTSDKAISHHIELRILRVSNSTKWYIDNMPSIIQRAAEIANIRYLVSRVLLRAFLSNESVLFRIQHHRLFEPRVLSYLHPK
jgi:hypothetical protein